MTPVNFDFVNKTITVSPLCSKRKSESQRIPMHNELIEPLQTVCNGKNGTDKIFSFAGKRLVKNLKADCQAVGIDPTDIDFHALRHTFCSLLAESGIRAEVLIRLARHKNLATTMRYYVHIPPESEAEAINRI